MLVRSWLSALVSQITRQPTRRERRASGLCSRSSHLHVEPLEDRRLMAFDLAVAYPVGTYPNSVVAADFNNDGQFDLVSANYGSNSVSVLLGNADGTFQSAINSPTGLYPLSVAVGDFNADDKLDLVTMNAASVSVLLGNGAGGFSAPANVVEYHNEGTGPGSVAVGDFNADGKLDLGVISGAVSAYGNASDFAVLLGNGDGSFSYVGSSYLSEYYIHNSAVAGDFNGDGQLDVAATSEVGTVEVALGDGTGRFGPTSYYWVGYYPGAVAAGDLNGDGHIDLVTTSSDSVGVQLGDGLGAFGPAETYNVASQPYSLALADFNGDGALDVATADGGAGTVSVLLGTGGGALKGPVIAAAGQTPLGIAAGDFDGDGAVDAAVANANSATLSVLRNDGDWLSPAAPSLSITDATVTEGNVGTVSANFTVSLSAPSSETVSVVYATADGGATAGSDFQSQTGTLTFTPGQSSQSITVQVNGDRVAESTEGFYIRLTNATNAFATDREGVGTIADDEPSASIESYDSVLEGNTSTTAITFTVTLSAPYDAPVVVPFATAEYWYGSQATAGVDYAAASGTVTFAPGDTSETITVLVTGDRFGEYDEFFWVNLGPSTSAHISSGPAVGAIVNDEPFVSIYNASLVEGHAGSKTLDVTVTLSAPYDSPVTVEFATADGSATAASGDYQATSGSVTFAIGQTTQTISIPVKGDRLAESDEYFSVNLATGYLLTAYPATGYGTILDDEPRISISSASIVEGNSGTRLLTFTVSLSAAYDQTVTVNYATRNGNAQGGSDYVATSGTLTFSPGQTTKTFTVAIRGDKKKEVNESFYVVLSGASSNALIAYEYAYGTILNDD